MVVHSVSTDTMAFFLLWVYQFKLVIRRKFNFGHLSYVLSPFVLARVVPC